MDYIELVKNTEIYRNCKNIVVGKGNENADILLDNYFRNVYKHISPGR